MVVIAEMAKFLRDAAMIGADVYFFQQLGEAASRRASAPDITEDDARLALEYVPFKGAHSTRNRGKTPGSVFPLGIPLAAIR